MYSLFRPLLFRLDPETAHALTLNLLRLSGAVVPVNWILSRIYTPPSRPVTAFGLTFKNPVGLAAGYDKDGLAIRGLAALGFGHVEIGTVTPLPQAGNPRPRLFRLPEDEAMINRMGFPSRGSEFLQGRLNPDLKENLIERVYGLHLRRAPVAVRPWNTILGINLGRNGSTPNQEAVLDYLALLQNFAPYADYLAINVSSPNTAGLRQLQRRQALEGLLAQLHAQRILEQEKLKRRLPLLVKLAPDLSDPELDDALEAILRTHMDGIIVTNTTLARQGLRSKHQGEAGGLSGRPLGVRSEAVLQKVVRGVKAEVPVVSVGGIMSPEDARRRLDMGARLIQIYTGLLYHGPGLARAIARSL